MYLKSPRRKREKYKSETVLKSIAVYLKSLPGVKPFVLEILQTFKNSEHRGDDGQGASDHESLYFEN